MASRVSRKALAWLAVEEQAKWIEEHGGTAAGYVARYGDYGDGGEAIYTADMAEFAKRMLAYNRAARHGQ